MNYGIEFEFFITKDNIAVPAYLGTNNLDGNPVVGELRTKVHSNIVDCVFELLKLIYLEKQHLTKKGFEMSTLDSITLDNDALRALRESKEYINRKNLEVLKEFSIYPRGRLGTMLPRGVYKSSLQVNFSENKDFSYSEYERVQIKEEYEYKRKSSSKSYSGIFDYITPITKLDAAFVENIRDARRVKGVYAIKPGELGDRVEYRSLPSTISLDTLMLTLR